MTADEFEAFVSSFNFRKQGLDDPDFVVLHHSANPHTLLTRDDARHGPEAWIVNGSTWDANEVGKTEAQIKAQRFENLKAIRDFYRDTNGWDRARTCLSTTAISG